MRTSVLILLFIILSMDLRAQKLEPAPALTFKIGFHIMGSYGTDWRSFTEENGVFFQPGLHGGLLYKDLFYVGMLGSKYCCFKYKDAYSFERNIIAGEIGIPIKKFLVGITIGKEDYSAPQKGSKTAGYNFQSILVGAFVDFQIIKNLSMPIRIAYTNDSQKFGYGPYWHASIGFSGNITIKQDKNK